MRTFLSHQSALTYWRYHFPLDSELGAPARVSSAEDCASCKANVTGSVPAEYTTADSPIDVLIFNSSQRRRCTEVVCHTWQTTLPPNAFYYARGVYVSSPEFVFLQMASVLPLEHLIALGCELCGRYILLSDTGKYSGSMDEVAGRLYPLTSTKEIDAFLDSVGKVNGKAKAKRALKYVIDGSRSPMETMVYMLLCLPVMLGGYGLPKPEMNSIIELDEEARVIARRRYCRGDLCWPGAQLDIEYHGEVHVGADQMKNDIGRELGIEHMGWKVITVTSPQVIDGVQFETVAKEVAACLQRRLRASVFEASVRRGALRYEIERWTFGA